MIRKRLPALHSLIFAIYPALLIWAGNEDMVGAHDWRTFAALLAGTVALLWLLKFVVPELARRAFLVTTFYLAFFSYTAVYALAQASLPIRSPGGQLLFPLLYFGAYVVLVMFALRKIGGDFLMTAKALNFMAILLLGFNLLQIGAWYWTHAHSPWRTVADQMIARNLESELRPAQEKPDIYYIILDGYGRDDVLEEIYGLDNSPFLDHLRSRGFFVPQDSHSNYPQTFLSLASSLNMTYLDEMAGFMGEAADDRRPLRYMIEHNSVAQMLQKAGYKFVFLSSGYSATESSPLADSCFCESYGLSELEHALLLVTPFSLWSPAGFPRDYQYSAHRQQILSIPQHLANLPPSDQPRFVFAHIFAPHPPFVFGPNGEEVAHNVPFGVRDGSHYLGTREQYVEGYRNQVIYLNQKVEEAVDAILARSEIPPIIILQADHGPGSMLDWESAERSNMKERLSIFSAFHLPEGGEGAFYDSVTPVNIFRIVFNQYFGAGFEMLDDKSYFATWAQPYKLVQVTPAHLVSAR